ncbi:MAG: fructosamine kinase family protein [Planctomycetota bacterium]
MTLGADVRRRIEVALGLSVVQTAEVRGGDINHAHRLTLLDGTRAFVKTPRSACPGDLYAAEAAGLDALRDAADSAASVPGVLAVGDDFLVLEALRFGSPPPDFEERLGTALAETHRASRGAARRFGFPCTTYLGRLMQNNQPTEPPHSWPTFWRDRRLLPLLEDLPAYPRLQTLGRRLADRLDTLLDAPAEPPTLVHGDLWSGNAAFVSEANRPALFDPACGYTHREAEFGMTRLFGFGPRFEAAYHEAFPLADGWTRRVEVYRLHHLLSHAWHFGGGYAGQAEALLHQLLRP